MFVHLTCDSDSNSLDFHISSIGCVISTSALKHVKFHHKIAHTKIICSNTEGYIVIKCVSVHTRLLNAPVPPQMHSTKYLVIQIFVLWDGSFDSCCNKFDKFIINVPDSFVINLITNATKVSFIRVHPVVCIDGFLCQVIIIQVLNRITVRHGGQKDGRVFVTDGQAWVSLCLILTDL